MTYGKSLFANGITGGIATAATSQKLSIDSSDILFTHISCPGYEDINFKLTGITSRAELMRCLKTKAATFCGMVVVTLRNFSQGWHSRFTLYQAA